MQEQRRSLKLVRLLGKGNQKVFCSLDSVRASFRLERRSIRLRGVIKKDARKLETGDAVGSQTNCGREEDSEQTVGTRAVK